MVAGFIASFNAAAMALLAIAAKSYGGDDFDHDCTSFSMCNGAWCGVVCNEISVPSFHQLNKASGIMLIVLWEGGSYFKPFLIWAASPAANKTTGRWRP